MSHENKCNYSYNPAANERGLALLMTIFVTALATVITMNLVYSTRFDARASRAFSNSIQAEYILKSGLNLGRVLLELPKMPDIKEDWQGEPWAMIGSAPSLPVSGVNGEIRLEIVDEEGKIDLNAVVESEGASSGGVPGNPYAALQGGGSASSEAANFWKNALLELFQKYGSANDAYDAKKQVAIIHDWIDSDSQSHSSAGFDVSGIESGEDKQLFYNRPLQSIAELPLVPGMTLERTARVAPYVRTFKGPAAVTRQINVNTAPIDVLLAIGFPSSMVEEMDSQRLSLPITKDILKTLVEGNTLLEKYTKVNSREFTIYSRVVMPNATRWLRASVTVSGIQRRRTRIQQVELH